MKLKDAGYLVRWAREQKRMSQYALADHLARHAKSAPSPDQSPEEYEQELEAAARAHRANIANYEGDRVQVPLAFLDLLTEALELPSEWHTRVKNSRQETTKSGDNVYIAEPVFIRRIPAQTTLPLRSAFIMDPKLFNKRASFPHFFKVDDDDDRASYPKILADEIEETDGFFREGDRWAFRTDLIPEPGHVVIATGKKGERLRRYLLMRDGRLVLADPKGREPDVPLTAVAMIEGVYVGWFRPAEEDDDPDDALTGSLHRKKGLRITDF